MLIMMNEKELHRLGVIKDICHKRITQVAATTQLNLTRRHIHKLRQVHLRIKEMNNMVL
ncbi:Putative transposase [Moritella viscosa]|uniref:Transposase n=1 Tax=Moritella viscosa TaxID=80854 RepID=A0A1K9ZGM3_9GAMM|nr:Putative transposase [Moritella viscosa]SGY96151.1 Putative transposase [Moritella viscosa]SGY96449.1 Putative transposase [Moritella viscosa]SHO05018.1 Putative transposase [Moritella viscosa]SHO14273.1 Putative transposase [Moritella viscosa]